MGKPLEISYIYTDMNINIFILKISVYVFTLTKYVVR